MTFRSSSFSFFYADKTCARLNMLSLCQHTLIMQDNLCIKTSIFSIIITCKWFVLNVFPSQNQRHIQGYFYYLENYESKPVLKIGQGYISCR